MSIAGAQAGDRVLVCFSGGETLSGIVKHTPDATGDSWVLWSDEGNISHVQNFETLQVLIRKAPTMDLLTPEQAAISVAEERLRENAEQINSVVEMISTRIRDKFYTGSTVVNMSLSYNTLNYKPNFSESTIKAVLARLDKAGWDADLMGDSLCIKPKEPLEL